jgi:hypothetical protein
VWQIILNQAGQMSQQRQEFSSLQQRLHQQLITYRHTCELQQKEITTLRGTLEVRTAAPGQDSIGLAGQVHDGTPELFQSK